MLFSIFKRTGAHFYTWTNPDGSDGGQVSYDSQIDPTAIVEKFAIVLSGSVIGAGTHVKMGDIIDGDTKIRFGAFIDPSRLRPTRRADQSSSAV